MNLLKTIPNKNVEAIIIAVDRMEKGIGENSTLDELEQEFGIKVYPIVNINEIVSYLYNNTVNGKKYINEELYIRIMDYQKKYGIK